MCKCEEIKLIEGVAASEQSLNSISLLELPIITDMSHEVVVSDLIDATESEAGATSATNADDTGEHLMNTGNELKSHEHLQSIDDFTNRSNNEIPVLWACRQCDFR